MWFFYVGVILSPVKVVSICQYGSKSPNQPLLVLPRAK